MNKDLKFQKKVVVIVMKVIKYHHLLNCGRVLGIIVSTWIVMYFI